MTSRHPNRCASNENDPGPRSTMAAARAARRATHNLDGSPGGTATVEDKIHTPATLRSVAAIGVRNPANREIPTTMPREPPTYDPMVGSVRWMRSKPATNATTMPTEALNISRPSPVRPSGNAENSRTGHPVRYARQKGTLPSL